MNDRPADPIANDRITLALAEVTSILREAGTNGQRSHERRDRTGQWRKIRMCLKERETSAEYKVCLVRDAKGRRGGDKREQ